MKNKKIKIAHIETGKHLYGGALQVLYLLSELKNNTDSVLLAPRTSAIADVAIKLGLNFFPLSHSGDFSWKMFQEIKSILTSVRPDLVHVHSRRGADFFGGLAAWHLNIPALLTRRVDNIPSIIWTVYQHHFYDAVICISPAIAKVLSLEGIDQDRLTLIFDGVNIKNWIPCQDQSTRAQLRSALGVAPNQKLFLVVAQLIKRKGHLVLLEALKKLPESFSYKVLCYGKGPMQDEIQNTINSYGLSEKCILMGFTNTLNQILPIADAIIHPAFREGLGVSLLQAASCGIPIIASSAGGIKDVFTHQKNAYLVEPNQPEALSLGINLFFNNSDLFDQYAIQARELISKLYSHEQMALENFKLYRTILEKRARIII
ncbi:MAG: glycosyltransferase family 4 protein [Methylacidiphilales bacterium]|nr:glycosyltransferase family 4 protein [Candidatus Methylacidiphilales bacterium]